MLVFILIVANFPVYLLLGWLLFRGYDRESVIRAVVSVIWRTFASRLVRFMTEIDDEPLDMTWGEYFRVLLLLLCCVLVVIGEYWLIKLIWPG